jgi:hypothetical protein
MEDALTSPRINIRISLFLNNRLLNVDKYPPIVYVGSRFLGWVPCGVSHRSCSSVVFSRVVGDVKGSSWKLARVRS